MKQFNDPLFDSRFLQELDNQNNREVFARIIALTFQETPVEKIEGRVTSGSISIDGTSAVRRTCSLSMIAKDLDINSFYWGIKTKFKLEIGLTNTIKEKACGVNENNEEQCWGDIYPQDIIWFPQGTFVITSFNTNQSTNNFTISISGKDKMCLLNGDLGGNLPASIDFGTKEFVDLEKKITTYEKVPIKEIIRESVHAYALEPYHNIIINDLDEAGLELLEYRGENSLYLLYNMSTGEYDQAIHHQQKERIAYLCRRDGDGFKLMDSKNPSRYSKQIQNLTFTSRVDKILDEEEPVDLFCLEVKQLNDGNYIIPENVFVYKAAKIEYGQTAGYRVTDLIYAGELISSIGESLTSILDKIKGMLGEFEYFYDLEGRFVFQRKQVYLDKTFNGEINNDADRFIENSAYHSPITYKFEGGNLITSYQNSPNLQNLKNDFSIWGTRKTLSGAELPIHYRYAIDTKPIRYTTIEINDNDVQELTLLYPNSQFKTQTSKTYSEDEYDWREIIYQMAKDYYNYGQLNDFTSKIINANKAKKKDEEDLYINGITGYEQYYLDIQGFWRQLYNPDPDLTYNPLGASFKEGESFSGLLTEFSDGIYTDYMYEKWKPGLAEKTEIVTPVKHIIPLEGNLQIERYGMYPLLDQYHLDEFTYADAEPNEISEIKEPYYISCAISEEYPDGKRKITKGLLDYIQKQEMFIRIDNLKGVSVIKNADGEDSYLWINKGHQYEAYLDRDASGNIIPNNYHTYLNLLDFIIQGYEEDKEYPWYYKRTKKETFYPLYVIDENQEIQSWVSDQNLTNVYFKSFEDVEIYSYIPSFSFDKFGNCAITINTEPVKNYTNFYKGDYEFYKRDDVASEIKKYWNKMITEAPDTLNFWFDFLEDGELDQFSVQMIGDRTKVVNDKDVKSIYFRDVPSVIFIDSSVPSGSTRDMELIELSDFWHFNRIRGSMSLFNISAQGKSAQDELENLLYNHSYCIESITLQALPIYYLKPNTRIFVRDDSSKINGEYIVSRLTIPLSYNGTMSITATKAPTRIY